MKLVSEIKKEIAEVKDLRNYVLYKTVDGCFTDDDGIEISWVEFIGIDRAIGFSKVITWYSNGRVVAAPIKEDIEHSRAYNVKGGSDVH